MAGVGLAKVGVGLARRQLALDDDPSKRASEDGYAVYILLRHLWDFEEQISNAGYALHPTFYFLLPTVLTSYR